MLDKLEIILINLFIQIFVYLLFYVLSAVISVYFFRFIRVNHRLLINGFSGGMSVLMFYFYCLYIKIAPFTLIISDHIIGL